VDGSLHVLSNGRLPSAGRPDDGCPGPATQCNLPSPRHTRSRETTNDAAPLAELRSGAPRRSTRRTRLGVTAAARGDSQPVRPLV